MAIAKELLDQLLETRDPERYSDAHELKKGLSERVWSDAHLDAETADGKTNPITADRRRTVLTGTSAGYPRGPLIRS